MSQSCPIARHCIPQKQTHQIAITALRSAAPASGGLGPKRVGRLPSFAMALSSASTSSTKASTSANASHGPGDVFAGRTAVPILYGLDAIDDGLHDGLSSFRAPLSIQPQVAVTATTVGMSSLQTDTEHESHYVFDICYHNTSDIVPTAITGDMHSVNKANFAVLHWFGLKFAPRFTSLQTQLPRLYCAGDITQYDCCLLSPAGQIDRCLITAEKANIDRIIATLGLKEMSQSTLIRKLCALPQTNPTRKAVFEFDKLIRSIYTLDYLRDPQLQRDVHRSQNRIESYHQLRAALTQVSGGKQLLGRTDLAVAISNQCGRLIANIIIAYNSILLSTLLERYQRGDNRKALALLRKISPVAWQHIHLLGHYTFRGNGHAIDLEALLANVKLG